jgi:hypothetical protein
VVEVGDLWLGRLFDYLIGGGWQGHNNGVQVELCISLALSQIDEMLIKPDWV